MHDAVIIGAGPGGLYTALGLARRGFDVVLLEEHESVGQPVHCTGIVAKGAFDEFDLVHDAILNELTTARFISPAGHQVVYRSPAVEAVVIDRAAFDARLAEDGVRAGVRVIRGARATTVSRTAESVTVGTQAGTSVRARVCVLACGGRYALHRQLGLGIPSLLLHTAQRELPASTPGDVEIHFGKNVAPSGFGWIVPVRRGSHWYARVGVMSENRSPTFLDRLIARVTPTWGLGAPCGPPRQKILPLSRITPTYGDRLIVVGDAAGLVKPTTGGGIYYSVLSGAVGAEVLEEALDADDLSADRLQDYERRWRARLEAELDTQLTFRMLVQQMPDADIEGLFELARTDGVMPIVRRTASFNRHRKLILALMKHPPARQIFFRAIL